MWPSTLFKNRSVESCFVLSAKRSWTRILVPAAIEDLTILRILRVSMLDLGFYNSTNFLTIVYCAVGNRDIRVLGVMCNNHYDGCSWQGTGTNT